MRTKYKNKNIDKDILGSTRLDKLNRQATSTITGAMKDLVSNNKVGKDRGEEETLSVYSGLHV